MGFKGGAKKTCRINTTGSHSANKIGTTKGERKGPIKKNKRFQQAAPEIRVQTAGKLTSHERKELARGQIVTLRRKED